MVIEHKTRTELVADTIREMIISGELEASMLLKQTKLADMLGVSRIPIREALYQLEGEGLVSIETHKGATVTPISASEIAEIFDLRTTLECQLLQQSMKKPSQDHLKEAEKILDQLDIAIKEQNNRAALGKLNEAFHHQLYRGADLALTLDIVKNLNIKAQRYVRMHITHAGGYKTAQTEHRALLALVKVGDSKAATVYLKNHLQSAKEGLLKLVS